MGSEKTERTVLGNESNLNSDKRFRLNGGGRRTTLFGELQQELLEWLLKRRVLMIFRGMKYSGTDLFLFYDFFCFSLHHFLFIFLSLFLFIFFIFSFLFYHLFHSSFYHFLYTSAFMISSIALFITFPFLSLSLFRPFSRV